MYSYKKEEFRREYETRLNRVIEYINSHLSERINLDHLAEIACFSPYHFHRIFTCLMDETVNGFIARLRLEKAGHIILSSSFQTFTDIAMQCGFATASVFSREFKKHFGMSPRDWRNKSDENRKIWEEKYKHKSYCVIKAETGEQELKVQVKELPAYRVAYLKYLKGYDPERIRDTFRKLYQWAGPKGLLKQDTKVIGIPYGDPGITPPEKMPVLCLPYCSSPY